MNLGIKISKNDLLRYINNSCIGNKYAGYSHI